MNKPQVLKKHDIIGIFTPSWPACIENGKNLNWLDEGKKYSDITALCILISY